MNRVYLGLGSNLPDRLRNLRSAVDMIARLPATRVLRQSQVYETEPVGECGGDFLNGVVEIVTELGPRALLQQSQEIERQLGRREPRAAPRTIDLDLLLFDDFEYAEEGLVLPHPRMLQRRFVLQPLCDLAPDVMIEGRRASEWLAALRDDYRVTRFSIEG